MKIFVVLSHIGGGGAERVGVLIAGGLAQRGYEVSLVTNLYEEVKYPVGEQVKILNMVTSPRNKLTKWVNAIGNLRRLVKQHQPDVMIGIMQLSSFISKIACIGTKTHVVMTEHDSFERPLSAPMSKIERFCKFKLNKIYECVTVITQADKDFIKNRLGNVVVMPNPLLLRPTTNIFSKNNVILAAGRLDSWHSKGFDVLIKVWGKLVDSLQFTVGSEGWKLQIAGTGSEKSLNYLKQLCKENGVENSVEFLGFRKDVEKLYQEASIFVLSSRYEGFGLVLIEAMSQGCACVACDYKGRQREIIQDESQGLLCEPDDVDVLAQALEKMILDKNLRENIRKNAVRRSEYYGIDRTMERWEMLLSKLSKKNILC